MNSTATTRITAGTTNRTQCPVAAFYAQTPMGKVAPKTTVTLTLQQFVEMKWLIHNYGLKKPGWLTSNFVTNQRRTAFLNSQISDAGLDATWCEHATENGTWSDALHAIWHVLNPHRRRA